MHFLLLGLLSSTTGCQSVSVQARPATKDTVATHYQLPGADWALFPAAAAFPNWLPEKTLAPHHRFTPTILQVAATEKALAVLQLLRVNSSSTTRQDSTYADTITQHINQYHRQYFGFYNRLKQPCVFINFLRDYSFTPEEASLRPKPPGCVPYWLRRYLFIGDGSASHWSIYYNLTTGRFYQYWHNLDLGGG